MRLRWVPKVGIRKRTLSHNHPICYPRQMTFFTRALLLGTLVIPISAAAQVNLTLRSYTDCKFGDGLAITNKSPLPPGAQGRTVETIAGPRQVALLHGEDIMFSYPDSDFFAKVKVEQLPPDSFERGKKYLIANFDHVLAGGDDGARNMAYALKPNLNGFEIYGLDRNKLEGNTLGIYLLIDNRTHIVTTAYFLNQEPSIRRFSTLAGYATLRDNFLDAYTSCVHAPHAVAAPIPTRAKSTVKPKIKPKAKAKVTPKAKPKKRHA
jgi:hypothetical protein